MDRLDRQDFARLVGALFGVAMGAAVALGIACLVFPATPDGFETDRFGLLDWVKPQGRHEDREKALFFLTLALGGTLGWLGAARYVAGRRPTLASLVFLAALVPGATGLIGAAMTAQRPAAAAYAALAIAVVVAGGWVVRRLAGDAPPAASRASDPGRPAATGQADRRPLPAWMAGALSVLVMTAFVVPLEATSIAATIGFDMHMASFMVGPATYSFADKLVPGIDYFTQYSVGTPWLFSFFLAPTATGTMVNAVWFVVAEMLLFQLSLLFFLRWFLRSWAWALVVGLACLMLQFGTPSPLYAPSSTSARYPLLMVCILLFVRWIGREGAWPAALALATALAGALFLNTETGIYVSAAVAIVTVIVGPGFVAPALRTIALGALTLVLFLVLNVVAFGPGVLQVEYLLRLLEPLLFYTGGVGAWPIDWRGGYHWIYNIVSPGIALASIGWVAASARLATPPCPRPRLAALAIVALVGLFMTTKFINMSIVGLWQVNAICLLVVIAWWVRALLSQLSPVRKAPVVLQVGTRQLRLRRGSPQAEAAAAAALLLLVFLCTITDLRNPSLYAVPSYRTHPTVVNFLLGGPDAYPCGDRTGCVAPPVSAEDVALLDRLTGPRERVALLWFHDWPTLIEARRASKFQFIPSSTLFTERQLKDALQGLDMVVLPRNPVETLGITNPNLARSLVPILRSDFKVVAETPSLLAWRRTGKP